MCRLEIVRKEKYMAVVIQTYLNRNVFLLITVLQLWYIFLLIKVFQILINLYNFCIVYFLCVISFFPGYLGLVAEALESLLFLSYFYVCTAIVFSRKESLMLKDDSCLCQCQPRSSAQSLDTLTIKL